MNNPAALSQIRQDRPCPKSGRTGKLQGIQIAYSLYSKDFVEGQAIPPASHGPDRLGKRTGLISVAPTGWGIARDSFRLQAAGYSDAFFKTAANHFSYESDWPKFLRK